MKLAIYSDLHLEFGKFQPPALDVDVVVLAGDIGKRHYGLRWAAQAFPTQQINGMDAHYPKRHRSAKVVEQ